MSAVNFVLKLPFQLFYTTNNCKPLSQHCTIIKTISLWKLSTMKNTRRRAPSSFVILPSTKSEFLFLNRRLKGIDSVGIHLCHVLSICCQLVPKLQWTESDGGDWKSMVVQNRAKWAKIRSNCTSLRCLCHFV